MRVVTVEEMRAIEAEAERRYGLDGPTLMAAAGANAANMAAEWLGGEVSDLRWLMLIGPGNNGGDGRVMARHLVARGATVAIYDWRTQRMEDLTGQPLTTSFAATLEQADVVVDAWLGIGHTRPLSEGMIALNDQVRTVAAKRHGKIRVIALDLPSGINADSGAVDPGTLTADLTITLAAAKIGLFFFPAMGVIGQLRVAAIGLPADMPLPGTAEWPTPQDLAGLLPSRPLDSHKGTFGKALIVAGSRTYPGAAALAARAAARCGAGLVTIATTADLIPTYVTMLPEAVYAPLSDAPSAHAADILTAARDQTAVLIGPGIGQSDAARTWLPMVLQGLRDLPTAQRPRLVVDADALNILSGLAEWWKLLPPETILTPHPGEMSRLLGGGEVSGGGQDRLPTIRAAAMRWGHIVVLKGAVTLIASPEPVRLPCLNAAPNPAMATAGMGDVLAGTIVALLAQHMPPFAAATLGVALHSEAGAQAARDIGFVRAGVLASEVADRLPVARAYYETIAEGE